MRRDRTLRLVGLAAVILPLASAAQAADVSEAYRRAAPPYASEEPRAAILVPDCEDFGSSLLRCAPREHAVAPDDLEVIRILRTVRKPRGLPYPQLVDRP